MGGPLVLQALWRFEDVVDLVNRYALVGQVEHLVVQVGIGVALGAHYLLNAIVAEARPAVGCKHVFRFCSISV